MNPVNIETIKGPLKIKAKEYYVGFTCLEDQFEDFKYLHLLMVIQDKHLRKLVKNTKKFLDELSNLLRNLETKDQFLELMHACNLPYCNLLHHQYSVPHWKYHRIRLSKDQCHKLVMKIMDDELLKSQMKNDIEINKTELFELLGVQ